MSREEIVALLQMGEADYSDGRLNNSKIITDQFHGYNILDKRFVRLREDNNKILVDGEIHTNNMEGFWVNLKRGLYGIYHHVSLKLFT